MDKNLGQDPPSLWVFTEKQVVLSVFHQIIFSKQFGDVFTSQGRGVTVLLLLEHLSEETALHRAVSLEHEYFMGPVWR